MPANMAVLLVEKNLNESRMGNSASKWNVKNNTKDQMLESA